VARLQHGEVVTLKKLQEARETVRESSEKTPLGFLTARPVVTEDFDYMFPELQEDPDNLLPIASQTRDALVELGKTMRDPDGTDAPGDSRIPAAYTYFGQFVDHDITFELASDRLRDLFDENLEPLSLAEVRQHIENSRTATLDLDSVYGLPAPRAEGDNRKMRLGRVTSLNGNAPPTLRPERAAGDDENDLPRKRRNEERPAIDREARIGDPRNDENTIIAQMQVAFLRAHNALVDEVGTFGQARRLLRQYYQFVVLNDFLKRIADPQIVNATMAQNRVYDSSQTFMPLEFSVAAYRFGHSMVRASYDFNVNFNTSGDEGTTPATLELLFMFTAFTGQMANFDTLPDNWIAEWQRLVPVVGPFDRARRIDTKLVEPLFTLTDTLGNVQPGDAARLAVRNLLRGYLLRMPTGQAVARLLRHKLLGIQAVPILTPQQVEDAAGSPEQVQALNEGGFLERTPLWYYVLAEAATLKEGRRLGPVGSIIVAEVLVGLVRRSEHSILRQANWTPTLPDGSPGPFTLADLLRLGRVL
jgi:hypothetical protein